MTLAIAKQKKPAKPSRNGVGNRNRTPRETKDRFVTLRARGLSFVKIAKKMGVARQTPNQELQDEVAAARAVELEALRERYFLCTESRMELFGLEMERIRDELEKRDDSDVPTGKLVEILIKLYESHKVLDMKPVFMTEEEITQASSLMSLIESMSSRPRVEAKEPIT